MNQDNADQSYEFEKGGEFTSENVAREGDPHARESKPTYDYPDDDLERQIMAWVLRWSRVEKS
jgi:hypothetical protein